MKPKIQAILLMLLCTVFTSVGQLLYKLASKKLEFNFFSLITNYWLFMGLSCYVLAFVLMMAAYRKAELTLLYPIMASSYVWVVVLAPLFFVDETFKIYNILGVLLIVTGIMLIGRGSK